MKRLFGFAFVVLLGSVTACGGDDPDGDGKGGGGSAPKAGSSGAGTAGSSAGTAGSASGGSGGASSTAGTASGGSAAGSAGSGTSGAGGAVSGDCAALCSKLTIQVCLGEYCVETCELAKQQFAKFYPQCSAQWDAQFACAAKQPSENLMCMMGKITSPGCTAEQEALQTCGATP